MGDREVCVDLTVRLIVRLDEGLELSEVVNEMDYNFTSLVDGADIEDTEILHYEIMDSNGILHNPIYAGMGPWPPIVPDDIWISCAKKLIDEEGPTQFLVNLLHVLRETLGERE